MEMKFETEASEPAVLSAIVISKSYRNERGPDDGTEKRKLWPKLGPRLFQENAECVCRNFWIYFKRIAELKWEDTEKNTKRIKQKVTFGDSITVKYERNRQRTQTK